MSALATIATSLWSDIKSVCVCECVWLNSSVMHNCASPLHMHASVTSMFEKSHTPVSKCRSSQFTRPSSQIPSQRYAVLGELSLSVVLFQTLAHARIIGEAPICWWRDGWALMSALVPHQHLAKMYFSCWQKPKAMQQKVIPEEGSITWRLLF